MPDFAKPRACPVAPDGTLFLGSPELRQLSGGFFEARLVLRELRLLGGAIGLHLAEPRGQRGIPGPFLLHCLVGFVERRRRLDRSSGLRIRFRRDRRRLLLDVTERLGKQAVRQLDRLELAGGREQLIAQIRGLAFQHRGLVSSIAAFATTAPPRG